MYLIKRQCKLLYRKSIYENYTYKLLNFFTNIFNNAAAVDQNKR